MNNLDQRYSVYISKISDMGILNKKALRHFFDFTWNIHNTNQLKGNYLSHLEKLASDQGNFYSRFAEFHFLSLLNKLLDGQRGAISYFLPERNNPDIQILMPDSILFIEVKSRVPSKIDDALNSLFKIVEKIPSGKMIAIEIKAKRGWKEIIDRIAQKLVQCGIQELSCKDFETKIKGEIINKNKTVIIGPSYGFIVDEKELKDWVEKVLDEKPYQLKKTHMVAIYSYDKEYTSDNFQGILGEILRSKKYPNIKAFLWVDFWNQNKIQYVKL